MDKPAEYDFYAMPADALREPPDSLWAALRQIGPGIILAGSIIGTGELLLTTGLGAKYGFAFLWLILLSCVVKVFVQVELGRYSISSGEPTLRALDSLPGPRLGAHWLVWWWLFMLLATVPQLGAMVGGIGQALHLAVPHLNEAVARAVAAVAPQAGEALARHPEHPWAVITAIGAAALLLSGGYKRIELITTLMVAAVTIVTVCCAAALPWTGYPIRAEDLREGFSFQLPAGAIAAAFATFGITGVGASELYAYPYWCLEKGYARYAGPRSEDPEWARRARGWMRVLYLDSWVSMLVFTVATVAFYCMGATVLYRRGIHPEKEQMIDQLSQMYIHAFGTWTKAFFLIGACVVLFKTLYVSSAGHSRLSADFLGLARLVRYTEPLRRARWVRFFCVFYPALALASYLWIGEPRGMVIFGGFMQAVTLPIISAATLYLRYRRTDVRLRPARWVDVCVWIAFVTITVVAAYAIWEWFKGDIVPLVRPSKP